MDDGVAADPCDWDALGVGVAEQPSVVGKARTPEVLVLTHTVPPATGWDGYATPLMQTWYATPQSTSQTTPFGHGHRTETGYGVVLAEIETRVTDGVAETGVVEAVGVCEDDAGVTGDAETGPFQTPAWQMDDDALMIPLW